MRVRVTVTVGGHGMAGDGMTAELIGVLRASGFEGDPAGFAMTRATDAEVPPEGAAALAGNVVRLLASGYKEEWKP